MVFRNLRFKKVNRKRKAFICIATNAIPTIEKCMDLHSLWGN